MAGCAALIAAVASSSDCPRFNRSMTRSHGPSSGYGVDAMITPSLVLLRLRTVGDAELEVWGARRKRGLFEQAFDRELEFSTHPSLR